MRAISLFTFVSVDTFGWGIDVNMKIVKVRMNVAPGSSVLAVVWECSTANVRWKGEENQEWRQCWDLRSL